MLEYKFMCVISLAAMVCSITYQRVPSFQIDCVSLSIYPLHMKLEHDCSEFQVCWFVSVRLVYCVWDFPWEYPYIVAYHLA